MTPLYLVKTIPVRWHEFPGRPRLIPWGRARCCRARKQAVALFSLFYVLSAALAIAETGATERLSLGVAAYDRKDYPEAIRNLKSVQAHLPTLADYVAYYLAAARLESKDFTGAK